MSTKPFLTLLQPHYNDLLNYCFALCANKPRIEAEDVFQETLLRGLRYFPNLKHPNKFRSWIFTIATSVFNTTWRRNLKRKLLFSTTDIHIPEVFNTTSFEEREQLYLALSKLSKKERTILLLFELGGFSVEEIRRIQKANSTSAIKSCLSRTRKKLQRLLVSLELPSNHTTTKEDFETELHELTLASNHVLKQRK